MSKTAQRFTFPVRLRPTLEQERQLLQWARLTRTLHQATELVMLRLLLGQAPAPSLCWEAAQAGELPADTLLPDPEDVVLIPRCQPNGQRRVTSDGLRDYGRAMLREAGQVVPSRLAEPVARRVYRPIAQPQGQRRGETELGQRRFLDILQAPGPHDPLCIPLSYLTLTSPQTISFGTFSGPTESGPGQVGEFKLPATTFHLPRAVWQPGDAAKGELQRLNGEWVAWITVKASLQVPERRDDVVGIDPGIRQWLTCADAHGTFELPGPAPVWTGSSLGEQEAAFEGLRPALAAACRRLLTYRCIALEGTQFSRTGWQGRETACDQLIALGHPHLREWLAGFANGLCDREVRLVPAYQSTVRCQVCGRKGAVTPTREFDCSHCGHHGSRDGNAAQVLRNRSSHGVPYRRQSLRYDC